MATSGSTTPTPFTWVRSIGAVTGNTILSMVALVIVAVVTARQLGPEGRGSLPARASSGEAVGAGVLLTATVVSPSPATTA